MFEIRIPVNELNAFDLPRVCVMAGAADDSVSFRKVKFRWYPPWVLVLLVVNILVMAIVARVLTRTADGELAFSEAAWQRGRALPGPPRERCQMGLPPLRRLLLCGLRAANPP